MTDKDDVFVNLSNHHSNQWSEKQLEDAQKFGRIADIIFPDIDPCASKKEIKKFAKNYVIKKIIPVKPRAVLCQGEMCFTYQVINLLKKANILVLAASSMRECVEKIDESGNTIKKSVFTFVAFREY